MPRRSPESTEPPPGGAVRLQKLLSMAGAASRRAAEALIAEGVLAVEMGAMAQDIALTMHPHPTLSETVGEAAEVFLGSSTHILPRKA